MTSRVWAAAARRAGGGAPVPASTTTSAPVAWRPAARAAQQIGPTGAVLVHEPGRALRRSDVEHALGVPIVAEVPWDPAIARSVDSGMLAARLPSSLSRTLRAAA